MNILILPQKLIITFLRFFSFLLTIRLTINWFPNFNPFVQPFFLLTKITDPYLRLFRILIPKIYGINISQMFAILWIECFIEVINIFSFKPF